MLKDNRGHYLCLDISFCYDKALIEIFMKKLILRGCALKQKDFVKYRPAIKTWSLIAPKEILVLNFTFRIFRLGLLTVRPIQDPYESHSRIM